MFCGLVLNSWSLHLPSFKRLTKPGFHTRLQPSTSEMEVEGQLAMTC